MAMRSWLFVPGDSENKLAVAAASGADAIVVDLEDSVSAANKAIAREQARTWLSLHRQQVLQDRRLGRWVRINPLDSRHWRDDLITVLPGAPDGIVLPKAAGPEAVQQLGAELYELEGRSGVQAGSTRILPLVGETASAGLNIAAYAGAPLPRLAGLTWGAEDLTAALGATRKRDASGSWSGAFGHVRAQTLLAAHARGVPAFDAVHADYGDEAGLKAAAEAARADGFAGMLAIHPAQIETINQAFAPSEAELAQARAIVAAFRDSPDAGTLQIDRKMIDRAHLKLAQRVLGIED
jgi:citrate lyase subunit beta / citryl-CoA lyase